MRALLLLLVLAVYGSDGYAQAFIISDINGLSDQYNFERSKNNTLKSRGYSHMEGSPYLSDLFIPGVVELNDSIRYEKVPLRYNIYTDKIEFEDANKQILEIANNQNRWKFFFGSLVFCYHAYSDRQQVYQGVLQILVDGNVQLFKKYSVVFKPATKEMGYQKAEPDRFVRVDDVYLLAIENQIPESFYGSKELIARLKQIKPGLDQFIKKDKINLKRESDLVKLIHFCNQ